MRWSIVRIATMASICVGITGLSAQERPKKERPANAKVYDESKATFAEGKQTLKRPVTVAKSVIVNGQRMTVTATEYVVVEINVPKRAWMIGAQGWHDFEGYNIDKLVPFNVNGTVVSSPLARIKSTVNGQDAVVSLEPGDVLTSVGGAPVTTALDLFIALHTADNPRDLPIEFIDGKTGDKMTGRISAMKVRP